MTPTDFELAVISAAVVVNIPLFGFLYAMIHKIDIRLVRIETRVGTLPEAEQEGEKQWNRKRR